MKNYETIIQENEDKRLNDNLDQGLECVDCKYRDECDFENDSICKLEDESMCDGCINDCKDKDMTVDACSSYIAKC